MPQPNILTILHDEHRKVIELFNEWDKTTARNLSRRQEIFNEIDESLSPHADFEEQQVYPLLGGRTSSQSMVLEAVEEHVQIKRLLVELRDLDPQNERWMAKAQVLMENVRHHVKEEEAEAFPQLRKDVDFKTLQRLAQEYQGHKELEPQQSPAAAASSKRSGQTPGALSTHLNSPPKQLKVKVMKSKKTEDEKDRADSQENEEK